MSFSARQLHCLEAMGLVAWTSTAAAADNDTTVAMVPTSTVPQASNVQTSNVQTSNVQTSNVQTSNVQTSNVQTSNVQTSNVQTSNAQTSNAHVSNVEANDHSQVTTALPDAIPLLLPELVQWIIEQPLADFKYRGVSVKFVGSDSATLLVVCLANQPPQDEPSQLLMTAESTQMFELMMRAIGMSRGGVRQCTAVYNAGRPEHHSDIDNVSTLCTVQTRAMLVLDPADVSVETEAGIDRCLVPVSSLPLFRIPHPQQMIELPQLKRRAWETLKSLQSVLLG